MSDRGGQQARHHHKAHLKQQNKSFKSKHASKGELKTAAKGRVNKTSIKGSKTLHKLNGSKADRRNASKLAQLKTKKENDKYTKIFDHAPRMVALIPLCSDVGSIHNLSKLCEAVELQSPGLENNQVFNFDSTRFKQRLQFISLGYRDFYSTLDACKVADFVIFILSPRVEVDDYGENLLRCLQAQGIPTAFGVIQNLDVIPTHSMIDVKKSLLSFLRYFVPSLDKIFSTDNHSECLNVLRSITSVIPRPVKWRQIHSYILADKVEFEYGDVSKDSTIRLTGTVRGLPMSASRLLHLQDVGDLQIEKIVSVPKARHGRTTAKNSEMDLEDLPIDLDQADVDADDLVSENPVDTFENEQTWPTEEEMGLHKSQADQDGLPDVPLNTTPKSVRRIPKGMSDYQAAWITEEIDEIGLNSESDEAPSHDEMSHDIDTRADDASGDESDESVAQLSENMVSESHIDPLHEDLSEEEENKQVEAYMKQRAAEDEEDREFPDEVITPKDIPARIRYQRYRGLKSFRSSHWDPYENLPLDYGRLFQFEDYERTARNVIARATSSKVPAGTHVTIHLKVTDPTTAASLQARVQSGRPIIAFSLLEHQHKKVVLNFQVTRDTEYEGTVKSKDPLILCIGARRFDICPLYSQMSVNNRNGVFKFENFLRHGDATMATICGPAVFGKQPCFFLKETDDPEKPILVATGSFRDANAKRIIAKRIMLTGHPVKVHKRSATIRYMFFNREDIAYFKPVQLYTKFGRTGHIKEPLGTHGYFKAQFDGPITQMDTICMSLYKRVFPKFAALHVNEGSSTAGKMDLEML